MEDRSYQYRAAQRNNGILVAYSTTLVALMTASSRSVVQGFHLPSTTNLNRKPQHQQNRRYIDSWLGVNGDSSHTFSIDGISGEHSSSVDPFEPPLEVVAENVSPSTPDVARNNFIDNDSQSSDVDNLQLASVEGIPATAVGDKTTPATVDEDVNSFSKRVPIAIRYSAESGLKPYFLTVAQRIKESYPDVILERIILPKAVMGGVSDEASNLAGSTFEVLVDGKVVVRTAPGRKDRQYYYNPSDPQSLTVFVSMQELDMAISRARRRRRPTTVYGEEGSNVRLEVLKNKASEIMMQKSSKLEK